MNSNLGLQDRLVRAAIGLLVLTGVLVSPMAQFTSPVVYYGAIILGVMALLNSVTGLCVIFRMIGVNTCTRPKSKAT